MLVDSQKVVGFNPKRANPLIILEPFPIFNWLTITVLSCVERLKMTSFPVRLLALFAPGLRSQWSDHIIS